MRLLRTNLLFVIAGLAVLSVVASACAPGSDPTEPAAAQEVEHAEDVGDEEEHSEEAGHEEEGQEHQEAEHEEEGEEHQEAGHEQEGEEHPEHSPDDHMAGAHDVPEDAAAVHNPFADDEDSPALGAELYAANCALCHGETGEGDGPGASGLEVPPAALHESHVQELTDGALFYIISHGKPETPMPAWESVLDEDARWHVVNYLRTFQ